MGRTPPVTSQALAPRAVAAAPLYRAAPSAVATREPVSRETTGSIEPGPTRIAANSSFGGWTSTGGTPIQVADGETAAVLAQRYGVPVAAFLQVNGLKSGAEVHSGMRITIPVYSASAPRAERVAEATPRVEPRPAAPQHAARERLLTPPAPTRVVAAAVPKAVPAHATRQLGAPPATLQVPPAKVAAAAAPKHGLTTLAAKSQKVPVAAPVVAAAHAAPVAKVAAAPLAAKPVKAAAVAAPAKVDAPKVAAAEPAPAPAAPAATAAAPTAVASADGSPEFRWPARGRIIQSFKGGSGGNDGINIAVPEGTSVRAAEGGVVAYAGSELKGYGNLVLIRHPNGFVSAYANNGAIDVKRGETVKRGQEIAKSGQSGNVSSPQLHFELRKGSTPVDPTQYLAGL